MKVRMRKVKREMRAKKVGRDKKKKHKNRTLIVETGRDRLVNKKGLVYQ